MSKLKPCPFCGSSGEEIQILHLDYGHGDETFEACCRQCGGRSCLVTEKDDAIEEWNVRPNTTKEILEDEGDF